MKSSIQLSQPSQQSEQVTSFTSSTSTAAIDNIINVVGSTTTVLVSLIFFIFLVTLRNAHMITFSIGSLYNGILSKVLKYLIDQNRPDNINDNILDKPNDKGMPSSHAMNLAFIATGTSTARPMLTIPLLIYVFISLYYRAQMNLHTPQQIFVGVILGTINAFFWQSLTYGTFPLLPQLHILQYVSIHLLPTDTLPIKYLIIPIIIGAAVVGSIERKIAKFINVWKSNNDNDNSSKDK